jgi:serine/threonine-protein kinase
MGIAGSRVPSGRSPAPPRLGSLLVEGEVARGPASVVIAARLTGNGEATRVAVKAYDRSLRVLAPFAARFEAAVEPRVARVRRADETGELPKDRIYRVTDLVRAQAGTLSGLGSLAAVVAFWAEVARTLGVLHARGLAHGHVRPEHALAVAPGRPLLVDAGVVLTPEGARRHLEHALLLAPEALEELASDRPAPATPEADVYALAASVVAALGGPAAGARALARADASLATLAAAKRRAPPPRLVAAQVPGRAVDLRALSGALARALSSEPDKRPRDGAALAAELAVALEPAPAAPNANLPEAAS